MDNNNIKYKELNNGLIKAKNWLLKSYNTNGSFGSNFESLFYYRIPWALSLLGENYYAKNHLNWIYKKMFSKYGEFKGDYTRSPFDERYGSYPLSCLLIAANIQQFYNITYLGAKMLFSWQNKKYGGFYNKIITTNELVEMELFPTCQGGMAFLNLGYIENAIRSGDWIINLWEQQKDIKNILYHVTDYNNNIITDYDESMQHLYSTKKNTPWQHHFNGGIAAAFLTQLYLATKNIKWLEYAIQYQNFSMTTSSSQFLSMQSCKSSWGSSLLYYVTNEKKYLDWTLLFSEWFLKNQHSDGHWENTKYWLPNPKLSNNIEITAEFIIHLSTIIKYVKFK